MTELETDLFKDLWLIPLAMESDSDLALGVCLYLLYTDMCTNSVYSELYRSWFTNDLEYLIQHDCRRVYR